MKLNKKTLIASLFGLSFVLFTFNARANDILEVTIDDNSSVVKMKVNAPDSDAIDFTLYNANERMIFSDRARLDESLESQVNLSGYRNGTYTLVSKVGNMQLNKVLEVKDSKVVLMDSYLSFVPVFQQEGDLLKVHFINSGRKNISVSIESDFYTYYDEYYDGKDQQFQKAYSLENLRPGDYTITFSSNGEFYKHDIEVM